MKGKSGVNETLRKVSSNVIVLRPLDSAMNCESLGKVLSTYGAIQKLFLLEIPEKSDKSGEKFAVAVCDQVKTALLMIEKLDMSERLGSNVRVSPCPPLIYQKLSLEDILKFEDTFIEEPNSPLFHLKCESINDMEQSLSSVPSPELPMPVCTNLSSCVEANGSQSADVSDFFLQHRLKRSIPMNNLGDGCHKQPKIEISLSEISTSRQSDVIDVAVQTTFPTLSWKELKFAHETFEEIKRSMKNLKKLFMKTTKGL